jgi:hypothetical protein
LAWLWAVGRQHAWPRRTRGKAAFASFECRQFSQAHPAASQDAE